VIKSDQLARQVERLMGLLHTRPRSAEHSVKAWTDNGGVSLPQMAVLTMLRERGPLTLSSLAGAVGVSAPAMSQLIDRMVQHGLVSREQDAADRRRTRLTATARSEALMERISQARRGHFERALGELPPELSRALSSALESVLKFYQEQEPWSQNPESGIALSSKPNSKTPGLARTAAGRSAKRSTPSRTPR
jgi:DNA-binding MarR family transcriptional regulator